MRSIRKKVLTILGTSVLIAVMQANVFAEQYRILAFDAIVNGYTGEQIYLSEGTRVTLEDVLDDENAAVSYGDSIGTVARKCLKYPKKYVHRANLNLRDAPETGNVLLTMPVGSEVSVISSKDGWSQIIYNGKTGYCSDAYLTSEHIIGIYSTVLQGDSGNTNNIKVASNYLNGGTVEVISKDEKIFTPGNGTIVKAGEEFSYLKIIRGESTPEKGYEESTVLIKGQREKGMGGGVCQVSSTLYAAIMTSDKCLDLIYVKERHEHSIEVGYIPKGLDATVWYDTKDLKIIPSVDIKINSYVEGGKIYVEIVKL